MDTPCDLTDRELHAAKVVGEHYAGKLRAVVVAVGFALAIAMGGGVTGWVLIREEASNRAEDLAVESAKRADRIQDSRLQIIIDGCEQTNTRNRETNAKLDALQPKPSTRESRRGVAATRLLIQALVPFNPDCEKSARARLAASSKP